MSSPPIGYRLTGGIGLLFCLGCSQSPPPVEEEVARPVSVLLLRSDTPAPVARVSGSVGSWQVEDIGFEVGGRVTFVIDPERDIEGRELWVAGKANEPTVLARLDQSRYELQEISAKAEMEATEEQRTALTIEENEVIPAQIAAAQAEEKFWKEEFRRKDVLFKRGTISQQEIDAAQAKVDAAIAEVAKLKAAQKSKHAEVVALAAKVNQQESAWKEATRNVADCILHSPFRGQVAAVHVIPGGYVERGKPVITVQMMDPIKIDFEVSATAVRQFAAKNPVRISFRDQDDQLVEEEASVYQTDPTADPATRTYTVTLLVRNEKVRPQIPKEYQSAPLPETTQVFRIHRGLAGAEDKMFIEEKAIFEDAQGQYLWQVKQTDSQAKSLGPILEVEKVRVQKGEVKMSIVNLYHFVEITLPGSGTLDPQGFLCTEAFTPPQNWDGKSVLLNRNQWLLRPGDLVNVHLGSTDVQTGFFVPMSSIKDDPDGKAIFVVESKEGQSVLKRTLVKVQETIGTRARIEPAEGEPFTSGIAIVSGRVHFLQDGESVQVVETLEDVP